MRVLAWLALACALAIPAVSAAGPPPRPYTIDDMLALQTVGRAAFSGDGRTLVYETQGPLTSAGRFDLEFFSIQRTGRLWVVDVAAGGPPQPLLGSAPGIGESLGALSPDGRRAIVYRLKGHANELGIVDLASRKVRWSGRCVDLEAWFSLARWRSDHEVVVLSTTPDTPSFALNRGWQTQARTIAGWEAAEAGQVSVSVLRGGLGAASNPPWRDADLIVFDVESGAVRPLARGPFIALSLSPNGATAALTAAMEPVTIDGDSIARNDAFDRRRRLTLVDLSSGRTLRPCPHCDMVSADMTWAPDGRDLLVSARPDAAKAGDWRQVRYWKITASGEASLLAGDVEPGTIQTIGGTNASLRPDMGWVGGAPAVLGRRPGDSAMAWWRIDPDGPKALLSGLSPDGGRRLAQIKEGFLVRTSEGVKTLGLTGVTPLASASDKVLPAPAQAGEPPGAILVEHGGEVRVLTSRGADRVAAQPPAGASLLAVAAATGATLGLAKTDHGVATLMLSEPGRPARILATLNAFLADIDITPPHRITHRTPQGAMVSSWLYLPADHKAGDNRPLIVVPYPGSDYVAPSGAAAPDARNYTTNVRTMVGAGYGVLTPSLPMAQDAEPAKTMAQAMLLAVDAALAADSGLSRTRLAVWGHSYGGYGALAAATQSPRFKAVIASSGISDLFSMWGEQGHQAFGAPEVMLHASSMFGWSETGQGRMLGPPWKHPQRYLDASPLLHADQIVAPVLLIQGDLDIGGRQSLEMFSALYRQGKSVELLYYRGEGHVVQSPGNLKDLTRRAYAFLQAALSADKVADTVPLAAPSEAARPSQ